MSDRGSLLSTPELDSLWPNLLQRWLDLEDAGLTLAAPFCSAAHESYLSHANRFMLIGRATKGDYGLAEFQNGRSQSPGELLAELKAINRHLVRYHPKSSKFWQSFTFGSRSCGPTEHFENAVWSNVGRFGFKDRDIDDLLYSKQADIAEHLLSAELEAYKPTVVHFAVNTLGSAAILRATQSSEDDWLRAPTDDLPDNVWTLYRGSTMYLWTRHPNWAPPQLITAWEAQISRHLLTHH
jgi:hypothetical protein